MMTVAAFAVFLAAFRMESAPAAGDALVVRCVEVLADKRLDRCAPVAGILIVAACVSVLAYRGFVVAVSRRTAGGLTTSRLRKAALLVNSAVLAASLIGLSDLAFLAGYHGYMLLTRM